jgi:RimJ/RimL family protein N-acetyltransferase
MPGVDFTEPLLSDRLTLRLWRERDVDTLHTLCQDPVIERWLGLPTPFGPEEAKRYVTESLPADLAAGSGVVLAIELTGTGQLAGGVGLYGITPRSPRSTATALAQVWLGAEHRGSGIATEALRTMARWGFDELGLDRILGYIRAGNEAVVRVNQRVGFAFAGMLRSAAVIDGEPSDLWVCDLLPGDLAQGASDVHLPTYTDRKALR